MASFQETSRALTPAQSGVVLTNPTQGITDTSSSGGMGSSFTGIENPEALAILMDTIRQMASGGTAEQKAQRAERQTQLESTRGTLGDYTKSAAYGDAADLMAQQLRRSLEQNMPAISKSIQGAGTSASSMQGLLSQKLATESAQSAGALGAEQAKAYGGISAQLQGVLEALTRADPTMQEQLLKALDLTKVQKSVQSQSQTSSRTGGGGGGSFYQPVGPQGGSAPIPAYDPGPSYSGGGGYSYAPSQGAQFYNGQEVPSGSGFIVNSSGVGTTFSGGYGADQFYSPSFDTGYERPAGATGFEGFTSMSGGSSDSQQGYWESDDSWDW